MEKVDCLFSDEESDLENYTVRISETVFVLLSLLLL